MTPRDQVIRANGVTIGDTQSLSLRDLLLKEHGIDIGAQPAQSLFSPQQAAQAAMQAPAPQSLFTLPPNAAALPALPAAPIEIPAPPAPPPSATFLEPARTNPGSAAPEPVPIMPAPSAGLIEATPYTEAPGMPGYAQARTGNPFRAPPAAAPVPSLFNAIAAQPYGQPAPTPGSLPFGLWYY